MSNAIKFTPRHGTVTITVKSSRVGCAGEKHDNNMKDLSEEEVVLITNSLDLTSLDSSNGFRGESKMVSVRGSPDKCDSADIGDGAVVDGDTCDVKKSVEPKKSAAVTGEVTYINDKCYRRHSTVIVSFLDTGAGICKVIISSI